MVAICIRKWRYVHIKPAKLMIPLVNKRFSHPKAKRMRVFILIIECVSWNSKGVRLVNKAEKDVRNLGTRFHYRNAYSSTSIFFK